MLFVLHLSHHWIKLSSLMFVAMETLCKRRRCYHDKLLVLQSISTKVVCPKSITFLRLLNVEIYNCAHDEILNCPFVRQKINKSGTLSARINGHNCVNNSLKNHGNRKSCVTHITCNQISDTRIIEHCNSPQWPNLAKRN